MPDTDTMRPVYLDDKFESSQGVIFINGTQALTRILLMQREIDKKSGLNTEGFVSGYRGSPLGALDMVLWKEQKRLNEAGVRFQPGLNEDLAATAIWGTQQLDFFPRPRVDGVYAMWYGKGPGVDRSGDAFRHGNTAGSHSNGGVLVVFGDDHPGKSSTVTNQSENLLAALNIPVLYPSNVAEIIRFGLLGWQLSRYSGLWVGLKTVNETVEQTQTVDLDREDLSVNWPQSGAAANVNIQKSAYFPAGNEMIVKRNRLPRVWEFVRANHIDEVKVHGKGGLGIISTGKNYQDLLQAFNLAGLSLGEIDALGIGIYKVGCIWPLEPGGLKAFARDCSELLILEEKTAVIEPQVRSILYNEAVRPGISGKHDPDGVEILPSDIQYTPHLILEAIIRRLEKIGFSELGFLTTARSALSQLAANAGDTTPDMALQRAPYFCSGCPHNTSTRVPEGSFAMSGIGCHAMVVFSRQDTLLPTQMGAEGLNWVGASLFSDTPHMFQNLGDGTYAHSGLLAIRAAVTAKTNITYKILFNDAVAMTGGQPVDTGTSVRQIARQVLAEGVAKCVLVSDTPEHFKQHVDPGVQVYHRDELDTVQKALREVKGTSVLIYAQTCAAEKRRRRKRGKLEDPAKRLFINKQVCENCGDCSAQSTCVSLKPVDTEWGVKRAIDQSSCNMDYSCVKGLCPSFVTITNAKIRKPAALDLAQVYEQLPAPQPFVGDAHGNYSVMIAGIGGTGVITVGAVVGMAANLDGKYCSIYDMTGLSQKNGAVYSHLKITADNPENLSQRIGLGEADLILAFDLMAALSGDANITYNRGKTRFLGNAEVSPTSRFQFDRNYRVQRDLLLNKVTGRLIAENIHTLEAETIAKQVCADSIASNMIMVGYALQKGLLPVSLAALEKAIELNGVAVEFNRMSLNLGRLIAHDFKYVEQLVSPPVNGGEKPIDDLIADKVAWLTAYQDQRYAAEYRATVDYCMQKEREKFGSSGELSKAVIRNLAKLMAYKDEYEVARLYSDAKFWTELSETFEPGYKVAFNLAPPLLARRDKATGTLKKMTFGPWMKTVFPILAKFKRLRGGIFDIPGHTQERRLERKLIREYRDIVRQVFEKARPEQLDDIMALLNSPDEIRGYGHVKLKSIEQTRASQKQLLDKICQGTGPA